MEVEKTIYMAYGSNTYAQIAERTGLTETVVKTECFAGIFVLEYYKILFSKQMTNGTGAANIHLGGRTDKVILFSYALPKSAFEIGSEFMRTEGCNFPGEDSRNHYNLLPFVLNAQMKYRNPEFKSPELFMGDVPLDAYYFAAEQSKVKNGLSPSPEYMAKIQANWDLAKTLGVY